MSVQFREVTHSEVNYLHAELTFRRLEDCIESKTLENNKKWQSKKKKKGKLQSFKRSLKGARKKRIMK